MTETATIVGVLAPRSVMGSDVWIRRVAWLVVGLSCLQILLYSYGRDQSIYGVVADAMLHGKMPYRDDWDFKPPGVFFVYAVAEALFGKSMAAIRIVEVAGVVGAVLAARTLGRTLFGDETTGLVGGALYALVHAELEFWHTGQPEAFGGMLTLFALVATTGPAAFDERRARRGRAWAVVGALFGAAFLLKPHLGGGAVVCAAYLARLEYERTRSRVAACLPFLVAATSACVPIAVCGLWFFARGAWPALSWTLFEFTPGYTALGWHGNPIGLFIYALEEMAAHFSFVLPFGIVLALALPKVHEREREALLLSLGIVCVHAAGIALQAKFFEYHYSATFPILALVAGLGLHKTWRRAVRLGRAVASVYAATVIALAASRVALRHNPGTFWERSADRMKFLVLRSSSRDALDAKLYHVADYDIDVDRRAARAVDELARPDEPVFVWGFEPIIYFFSARQPASHFLYDVPQRATWQRERARRDLMSDLRATPPKVIVVEHGDVFSFVTGNNLDSANALATFPELDLLISDGYRFVDSIDDLDVYSAR